MSEHDDRPSHDAVEEAGARAHEAAAIVPVDVERIYAAGQANGRLEVKVDQLVALVGKMVNSQIQDRVERQQQIDAVNQRIDQFVTRAPYHAPVIASVTPAPAAEREIHDSMRAIDRKQDDQLGLLAGINASTASLKSNRESNRWLLALGAVVFGALNAWVVSHGAAPAAPAAPTVIMMPAAPTAITPVVAPAPAPAPPRATP